MGQRIAQLVFSPVIHPQFDEITLLQNSSSRGTGGFGSTGTKPLGASKKSAAPLRTFKPTIPTIFKVQNQHKANKSYSNATHTTTQNNNTDVATMPIDQIQKIVNSVTETHVEDVPILAVPIPAVPKEVHENAITLLPLSMNKEGTLNIIGTAESPEIEPAPSNSPSENPTTDSPHTDGIPNDDNASAAHSREEINTISSDISSQDFSVNISTDQSPEPTIFINKSDIYCMITSMMMMTSLSYQMHPPDPSCLMKTILSLSHPSWIHLQPNLSHAFLQQIEFAQQKQKIRL